jgi:hypothetical protein
MATGERNRERNTKKEKQKSKQGKEGGGKREKIKTKHQLSE